MKRIESLPKIGEYCHVCGNNVPQNPWYRLRIVDGKEMLSPICDECSEGPHLLKIDDETLIEIWN